VADPTLEGRSSELARALSENARYAEAFDRSRLTAAPLAGLAIITCMDARIDVEDMLGLRAGDAHILRNAGGHATDDMIRSLIVSQQLLGTNEIVVIGHNKCGLHGADEADLRARAGRQAGSDPEDVDYTFEAFPDLNANVALQVERLRADPYVGHVPVHGFVYDVDTGRLYEVA
jgi:carbonic anhydrase